MRKLLLRTLLLTLLFAMLFTVTAFAEDAVVTGSDVNLRSGPGTNYPVLDCLPKGATVTVNDRSNSQWYSVSYNGRSGFVSAQYLRLTPAADASGEILVDDGSGEVSVAQSTPAPTPSLSSSGGTVVVVGPASTPAPTATPKPTATPAPTATPSGSSRPGTINAMYVNFRSGPSTGSSVLGTYNKGKALTITGTSGDWTACTIDGKNGYVFSQYVTAGSSAPTPTPTPTPKPTATPAPTPTPSSGEVVVEDPAASTPAPTPTPAVTGTVAYISGDYVRFRSGPSTSSAILGTYNKGKKIGVTGKTGDWTACNIDGKNGYVYSQYVSSTDPTSSGGVVIDTTVATSQDPGYINANNVRLRSAPSTSSSILAELNSGTVVTFTGLNGDWAAVIVNGQNGYVYRQYVTLGTISVPSGGGSGSSSSGSGVGAQAAQMALQYVGYNYKWGGQSPSTGFDCSGLVYYVYKQLGYTLPRVANDQASYGTAVSYENIQPGDILCFYSGSNYVGHVGLYIGDNKFVHASTSTTGVIISELNGYYVSRGFVIRRVA